MNWLYEPPKDRDNVVWLLTIMGVFVKGKWQGRLGEYFIGYREL